MKLIMAPIIVIVMAISLQGCAKRYDEYGNERPGIVKKTLRAGGNVVRAGGKVIAGVATVGAAALTGYNSGVQQSQGGTAPNLTTNKGSICPELLRQYNHCKREWENIGGGSSGQAGAFKQCWEDRYNAGIAAGCW